MKSQDELLSVLSSPAEPHEKAVACQELAVTGGPEAVPALANLLGDAALSDYARCALEMISGPAATGALRAALENPAIPCRGGIIDSLGVLRDAAAVPGLIGTASGGDEGLASEALLALGKIGGDEATGALCAALSGSKTSQRVAAAHGCLLAARALLDRNLREGAVKLMKDVVAAELPDDLREVARSLMSEASRTSLFDGKTLEGWDGDLTWFRVTDGAVVAGSLEKPIPQNEFLATRREYGDFELRLKVRLLTPGGNGGIQFRSERVPDSREMKGYQADVAEGYWGLLYDESRRATFLGTRPATTPRLMPGDWNTYRIRCEGSHVRLWLNGQLTTDFTESDPGIPARGHIALQIHGGTAAEVWYKDIEIQELATT